MIWNNKCLSRGQIPLSGVRNDVANSRSPSTLVEQEIIEALPYDTESSEALQRYAIAPIYQILQDRVIVLQTYSELKRLHFDIR